MTTRTHPCGSGMCNECRGCPVPAVDDLLRRRTTERAEHYRSTGMTPDAAFAAGYHDALMDYTRARRAVGVLSDLSDAVDRWAKGEGR